MRAVWIIGTVKIVALPRNLGQAAQRGPKRVQAGMGARFEKEGDPAIRKGKQEGLWEVNETNS